jgi:2-keto-4-pentenoate hydratase/2-oxohepta-3-ene-1,7-dioic acid hydratase in catechol pathway
MRLARVAFQGEAFWALVNADSSRLQRIRAPFAHWATACALGQVDALALDDASLAVSDCQWLPPLEPGARVFGVGLNYLSHLQRLGSAAPEHALAYIKPESAIIGAHDDILYPALTATGLRNRTGGGGRTSFGR